MAIEGWGKGWERKEQDGKTKVYNKNGTLANLFYWK